MIKREKANGFALVLSLVLLMVMSLMGGSLVVISSTDHKSNNSSDEYQQAFYVAETGLLEAEKDLMKNQCLKSKLLPHELAQAVLFFSSEQSGGCTNQSYIVDKGWL